MPRGTALPGGGPGISCDSLRHDRRQPGTRHFPWNGCRDGVKLMQRKPDPYDSSRWTGYSEPLEAEALMLVLALGAVCFLIIGLETL